MLARTPALAGLRRRPLLQTSPVGPPAPAFPVKKPSAAHRRQPPGRAKPVISPLTRSLEQGGPRPPPGQPAPSRANLPTRQPTEYSRRPRAARGRRGGDERPGTPRGGGAAEAKGRGPRRAGEVAHPRLGVPSRARWAPLRMLRGKDAAVTCLASDQPPCKLNLGVSPPRDAGLGARAQ